MVKTTRGMQRMSTTIQNGDRFITLPNSPTAEDYVIKLEKRLELELAGHETILCRELCEVARRVVDDERRAGRVDLQEWISLTDRILVVSTWLIDNDRW